MKIIDYIFCRLSPQWIPQQCLEKQWDPIIFAVSEPDRSRWGHSNNGPNGPVGAIIPLGPLFECDFALKQCKIAFAAGGILVF